MTCPGQTTAGRYPEPPVGPWKSKRGWRKGNPGVQGSPPEPTGFAKEHPCAPTPSYQDAQLNPHNDEVPIDDQVYTKLELTKHEAEKPIYMTTLVFE